MDKAVSSPALVRFGTFEVDLRAGELRKAGVKLKLTGQPFQVLAILLEQPGEVVTRDELQKRLWPDTFVDVDHNLNTAINKIREVLGDSAESPRFVETLPRRGYRFIAPVEGPRGPATAAEEFGPGVRPESRIPTWVVPTSIWCVAILLVAGLRPLHLSAVASSNSDAHRGRSPARLLIRDYRSALPGHQMAASSLMVPTVGASSTSG